MLVLQCGAFQNLIVSFYLLVLIAPTIHCLSLSSSSSPPPPTPHERTVVLLLYKPPNVVTSHVSNDDRPTVYNQVQDLNAYVGGEIMEGSSFQEWTGIRSKVHAIGRLDADTTGLLLLTNDGGLVHHVTNKNAASLRDKSNVATITKTYQALVMGHQTEDTLRCFWEGVDIGTKYGGRTAPVDNVQILEYPNHKSTLVSITISEGKNRQVRRMFHSIGSGVMQLKRVAIGNDYLTLEGLQEGQWRVLSDEEVKRTLQWEPKVLENKTGSIGGRQGSGSPRGKRPSSTNDRQTIGKKRRRPSGKVRRSSNTRRR
ncbi:unnamed protein product [Cylindrotheca closterium]|uniref:Pseudouridine synthase RsuA/RluA-like domain-containing protein n=1 Tax=Cylindrotheca closterium TaxID=2856 RepID=A0AAD2PVC8_9STRA|nr:unnamed protein product [Cylindrotheca closterium]